MKEIVIISGKGGTGKTTLTGAFAVLAGKSVLADCDVDAADLHLIIQPEIEQKSPFISGNEAVINNQICINCEKCFNYCRFEAIAPLADGTLRVDSSSCEGCGACLQLCPVSAIEFPAQLCGHYFHSATAYGPMVHAELAIGAENSGRLVTLVRKEAAKIAKERALDLIIVDGPPGIGCPVIASITGADAVVLVAEPSLSGLHDLKRVAQLSQHFNLPLYLCINKWDLNPQLSGELEEWILARGGTLLGRIAYSKESTRAQIAGKTIVENGESRLKSEVEAVWNRLYEETILQRKPVNR